MSGHMRNQLKTRSALDHYDFFTGWQSKDPEGSENILKHFRNNLNKYQDNFKEKQQQDQHHEIRIRMISREKRQNNKENQAKLPVIAWKEGMQRKGSFLALRNRNILKQAIECAQHQKKQALIIHEMVNKLKKTDPKEVKEMKDIKEIRQIKETRELKQLNNMKNFLRECRVLPRGETCCLKERKECNYISNPSHSIHLNRIAFQDIDDSSRQFSDQKIVLTHNRIERVERVGKLLFRRENQEEL